MADPTAQVIVTFGQGAEFYRFDAESQLEWMWTVEGSLGACKGWQRPDPGQFADGYLDAIQVVLRQTEGRS
jgi:hypothetical protein